MMVEGHKLTIEVNNRAAVSPVSEEIVNYSLNYSLFPMCLLLQQTNVTLLTYTGPPVSILGQPFVKVQHDKVQEIMSQVNITGERSVT